MYLLSFLSIVHAQYQSPINAEGEEVLLEMIHLLIKLYKILLQNMFIIELEH